MNSDVEKKRQEMLAKLASRHEKRALDSAKEQLHSQKVDLRATGKAFLKTSPSTLSIKTPLNANTPKYKIECESSSSPVLSFDEEADKQIIALSIYTNTMIGSNDIEEMDLCSTSEEATERIKKMLSKKMDVSDVENSAHELGRRRYRRIFEKNDAEKIRKQCKKLLVDSGIEGSILDMLSKKCITIADKKSVYNDLGLQTTLLGIFLSFHPAWLKAALEAVFNAKIDAQPKSMLRALSHFMVERLFSNPAILKNKKYAQGSGKPTITEEGRDALHGHFLKNVMKLMFVIEVAFQNHVIPNLTRIFTKSSQFKSLDSVWNALTQELLPGSSLTFKKAFNRAGFTTSYTQSFIESYDYQAKGFEDFSDGLILAKLIETVGEMKHGTILLKLRDPAGDRIRKVNNVKHVLKEMSLIGIPIDNVKPEAVVGGKKDAILSILWSIVGVRVAKEKRIRMSRAPPELPSRKKGRRSDVHDDITSEVLKACKKYGRALEIEVLDVDSLTDGILLDKVWSANVPNGISIQSYNGQSLWEKVVSMAEVELGIPRGLDQNMALFVKMFLERTQTVRMYNEKAATIQKMWRAYLERKKTPKLYFIVKSLLNTYKQRSSTLSPLQNSTFVIPKTPGTTTTGDQVLGERLSTSSMTNASWCDATFTVSRDSIDTLSNVFKQPRTPLRGTFTRNTLAHLKMKAGIIEEEEGFGGIGEEEGEENDETVVPNTSKKRVIKNVFKMEEEKLIQKTISEVVTPEDAPEVVKTPESTTDDNKTPEAAYNQSNARENVESPKVLLHFFKIPDDVKSLEATSDDVTQISETPEFSPEKANVPEFVKKILEEDFTSPLNTPEEDSEFPKISEELTKVAKTIEATQNDIKSPDGTLNDVKTEDVFSLCSMTPGDFTSPLDTPEEKSKASATPEAASHGAEVIRTLESAPEAATDDSMTREHVNTPEYTLETVNAAPITESMEQTQPSTSSTSSIVSNEMIGQIRQNDEEFRLIIERQQLFVRQNQLEMMIEGQERAATTPELRRILREAKELKRKQEKVLQAKKLGSLERQAMAYNNKENAFIEYSTIDESHMAENHKEEEEQLNRSDAGNEDAITEENMENEDVLTTKMDILEKSIDSICSKKSDVQGESAGTDDLQAAKNLEARQELERNAAILIQKMARGFLARCRARHEIEKRRNKMVEYNRVLATEKAQFKTDETDDETVEMKLRNCALGGLTNDNLHIVHIAATIIDRVTDLVPALLPKFVADYNGFRLIYDILAVADQGIAYMSILNPLLRILRKSVCNVPEEVSNPKIAPILPKMSPRLVLLMCKHCLNKEFFNPIIISLIAIARRFPTKKDSALDPGYAIRQTMKKVTDQDGRNYLITLQNVCDHHLL